MKSLEFALSVFSSLVAEGVSISEAQHRIAKRFDLNDFQCMEVLSMYNKECSLGKVM